jgi:hypothetical protein
MLVRHCCVRDTRWSHVTGPSSRREASMQPQFRPPPESSSENAAHGTGVSRARRAGVYVSDRCQLSHETLRSSVPQSPETLERRTSVVVGVATMVAVTQNSVLTAHTSHHASHTWRALGVLTRARHCSSWYVTHNTRSAEARTHARAHTHVPTHIHISHAQLISAGRCPERRRERSLSDQL